MTARLRRVHSLGAEMGIVALVILVWQAARIPFKGSHAEALAHASDWISAERSLHIHFEPTVIRFVNEHVHLHDLARLGYDNLHLLALFAFMAAARMAAPWRYPKLRTTFAALHVPALLVLALFPLAPPHWVAGLPSADGPPAHSSALRNDTAAAVSLHFGYAVFIAGAALWLWPRSRRAWLTLLYPALVFLNW